MWDSFDQRCMARLDIVKFIQPAIFDKTIIKEAIKQGYLKPLESRNQVWVEPADLWGPNKFQIGELFYCVKWVPGCIERFLFRVEVELRQENERFKN